VFAVVYTLTLPTCRSTENVFDYTFTLGGAGDW
jgi:hypothetical protein